MNTKILKVIGIISLIVAAIVTVRTMLQSVEGKIDLIALLFVVWAVSPYIAVFGASALLEKFTRIPKQALIFCFVSVLMLVLTLLMYLGTLTGESSTEALIFVFAPIYLYIGSFVIFLVGIIAAKFVERQGTEVPPIS